MYVVEWITVNERASSRKFTSIEPALILFLRKDLDHSIERVTLTLDKSQ